MTAGHPHLRWLKYCDPRLLKWVWMHPRHLTPWKDWRSHCSGLCSPLRQQQQLPLQQRQRLRMGRLWGLLHPWYPLHPLYPHSHYSSLRMICTRTSCRYCEGCRGRRTWVRLGRRLPRQRPLLPHHSLVGEVGAVHRGTCPSRRGRAGICRRGHRPQRQQRLGHRSRLAQNRNSSF